MPKLNTTEEGTVYRFIVGERRVHLGVAGEPEPPPDSLGITMDKENYEIVMERLSKYREDFENGRAAKVTVFFPGIGNFHNAKIPRQFQTGEFPTGFIAPILSEEEEEKRIMDSINMVTDAVKKAESAPIPIRPPRCPKCARIFAQHFENGIITDYCINGCDKHGGK